MLAYDRTKTPVECLAQALHNARDRRAGGEQGASAVLSLGSPHGPGFSSPLQKLGEHFRMTRNTSTLARQVVALRKGRRRMWRVILHTGGLANFYLLILLYVRWAIFEQTFFAGKDPERREAHPDPA